MITPGNTYLITTNEWFIAPDGNQYRAVFGTVYAVKSDEETLGIKTNRGATNWYVEIGGMFIAGCQIHYAIRTETVDFTPPVAENLHEGQVFDQKWVLSRIYNANGL